MEEKLDLSKVLYFDTETTGVGPDVRIVQLAWSFGGKGKNYIIRPDGFEIPAEASAIHGITTERAMAEGVPIADAMKEFLEDAMQAEYMCAHNLKFDRERALYEISLLYDKEQKQSYEALFARGRCIDTMLATVNYVKVPFANKRGYKWPKLSELREKLIEDGKTFSDFNAHDANEDVRCLAECHAHLVEMGLM